MEDTLRELIEMVKNIAPQIWQAYQRGKIKRKLIHVDI